MNIETAHGKALDTPFVLHVPLEARRFNRTAQCPMFVTDPFKDSPNFTRLESRLPLDWG